MCASTLEKSLPPVLLFGPGVLWQSKADIWCEVLAAMCPKLELCAASAEQPFFDRNWAELELV